MVPSLIVCSHSFAASFQKLPDSVAKSVSTASRRLSRCVRRNDQFIDKFQVNLWFCTCNVHKI